jgi:hypothetical protein
MWRTAKQALKEYWLAFVVGLIWTTYVGGFNAKLSVYISNFAGSFFLTSWALGQINRIRRDHATKDALARLEAQMAAVDVSISRWTANAKAFVPTPKETAQEPTAPLTKASAPVPETKKEDRFKGTDKVIDFNKYRHEHPPPPPLPPPACAA